MGVSHSLDEPFNLRMTHSALVVATILFCLAVVTAVVWLIAHAGIVRGAHLDRHLFERRRRLAADPRVDEDRIVS